MEFSNIINYFSYKKNKSECLGYKFKNDFHFYKKKIKIGQILWMIFL